MKFNIFIVAFKFHGPPINDKDLEIIYCLDKTMNDFSYSIMDKVMRASTINQHHYLPMFNKTSDFESMRRRNDDQGMK